MLTETPPRKKNRTLFVQSDQMKSLEVPQDARLPQIAAQIELAMKSGSMVDVRGACAEFLVAVSGFYRVPRCEVRVLASRPLRVREYSTTELFGDYHPDTMLIRVWMRTAIRKDVTSFGTFLSTLCHEFCHHLDFHLFHFPNSWHTRGFYERTAALYHHARATPPKTLVWVRVTGGKWRIDWPGTNRASLRTKRNL
jgi:hypothetical protein